MKNLTLIIICICLVSLEAYSQNRIPTETFISESVISELTIKISGLDSDQGTLKVGIYTSEGSWLSKSKFSQVTEIVNGSAIVIFEEIPSGTYGISTYHDEDDNSVLDTNVFGIPSEPYASSRGAKGRFGPPKWKDAKFEIKTNTHTEEIKF